MHDDILPLQRSLRRRLFEGPDAIRWRPGRDLAAHLLLYLDDAEACWRIAAEWLREHLDADRVDGGFGGFIGQRGVIENYVVSAEVRRGSLPMPRLQGLSFNGASPCMRSVWRETGVFTLPDVSQTIRFTDDERLTLLALGTAAKLALPIRDHGTPIGLMCADWHREVPHWSGDSCHHLGELTRQALGPLLAAAAQWHSGHPPQPADPPGCEAGWNRAPALQDSLLIRLPPPIHADEGAQFSRLTPAERKVAQLVAVGLSYKEVARQLNRSLSTVDHQLRSIREKLGVRSTARLVHMLTEQLAPPAE